MKSRLSKSLTKIISKIFMISCFIFKIVLFKNVIWFHQIGLKLFLVWTIRSNRLRNYLYDSLINVWIYYVLYKNEGRFPFLMNFITKNVNIYLSFRNSNFYNQSHPVENRSKCINIRLLVVWFKKSRLLVWKYWLCYFFLLFLNLNVIYLKFFIW